MRRFARRLQPLAAAVALCAACGEVPCDDAACRDDAASQDAGDAGADLNVDAAADDVADSSSPDGAGDAPSDAERALADLLSSCADGAAMTYAPLGATISAWPDGAIERADPATPTGVRLDPSAAAWTVGVADVFAQGVQRLAASSGFAASGDLFVQFDQPIDAATIGGDSRAGDGLRLVELRDGGVDPLSFDVRLGDEGRDIFVDPRVPLRQGARHALIVTSALRTASGGCVAPPGALRDALGGDADGAAGDAMSRVARAAALAGLGPGELVGGLEFVVEDDAAAAAAAADRDSAGLVGPATCELDGDVEICELHYRARDHRSSDGILDGEGDEWELAVRVWLPATRSAAVPVVVYGHGMGNDREEASRAAEVLVPLGFAVAADDAVLHGDHPTALGGEDPTLPFVGVTLEGGVRFTPSEFRENLLQTALDRAALVAALALDGDVTADGVRDIDGSRVAYWGVSLGAFVGANLIAISPETSAFVLAVGGGELVKLITGTDDLAAAIPIFGLMVGGEAELERLLVVAQSTVDAADPTTTARRALEDRASGPSVLLQTAEFDDTVSPASGRALARALGLAHVAPVATPVVGLEVVEAPVAGNGRDASTLAYFQFDRVGVSSPTRATHGGTPFSAEGSLQTSRFLTTWADGEAPEVVDPYAELGTPGLGD
ncbi:MAG: hypothetical protein H6698_07010 [Myxococcales bacterium]|nr:hypothetical protein [Myxococcales bacterium]MCB9531431.1 hypothetical protein [Myxococcales bacterium]MCB9534058.1 hypothetical protein [Myxococcales bacterium]